MQTTDRIFQNVTASRPPTTALPGGHDLFGLAVPGTLHLRVRLADPMQKLLGYLRDLSRPYTRQDDMVSIDVTETDMTPLVLGLMEVFSPSEQAAICALFQPEGKALRLADFFEINSLHTFICKSLSGWLIDTMQENRLTTVFQPIVHCDRPDEIFAYECLLRSTDGERIIYPNRMLDVARGAGLLFQLDLAARRTAISEAARFHIPCKIFINFTPTAIADPVYGLRSTVEAVDELGLKREQVVFEVIESELIHDVAPLKEVLDYYRSCGFGVALDDLGSGYSSLNLLGQLRPDYVKLDRGLMHSVHVDGYKALIARKLIETAQELGISTIAEGVECRGEYEWLQAQNARFAQGFYFSKPASPPPRQCEHAIACAA